VGVVEGEKRNEQGRATAAVCHVLRARRVVRLGSLGTRLLLSVLHPFGKASVLEDNYLLLLPSC
jgi:hypothetical protein